MSQAGQCLTNSPLNTFQSSYLNTAYLPGQFYTLDQQCQSALGPNSSYSMCKVRFKFKYIIKYQ